jgi:hypothetical protein
MCGIVESLNLAVSTGIVLHEIASQRREFTRKRMEFRKQANHGEKVIVNSNKLAS